MRLHVLSHIKECLHMWRELRGGIPHALHRALLDISPSLSPSCPVQPIRRDTGPPKDVFILYCNDKRMKGDFSNAILLLSDFLTGVCGKGTKVHCDIYDDFRIPGNWNRWTEERITQSNVVLLVCSPTLIELLHDQDRPVQMKKGMFNAGMVYNLIQPPKFLPVFINDDPTMEHIPDIHAEPYSSWVPNHLKGTSRYWLDLEALHREMGNTDMMSTEEYWDRLSHLLSCHKKFEQIAGLLRDLQCTPGTQPPDPLPSPIVPLPTGTLSYCTCTCTCIVYCRMQ